MTQTKTSAAKRVLRAAFFLLCLLILAAPLSGCGSDLPGKSFRYDIASPVKNLDPQYATDTAAIMVLSNIFEGLLVSAPDGSLSPGAATDYEVAPDNLTYTFRLREDACWSGKDARPVTAHDFVFAFRRMFNPAAPSPYAQNFIHIRNAAAVLSGELSAEQIGVRARDDYTLIFTLEREIPLFPELLASTAAMPCDRAAFDEARGRYGLEQKFVSSNGPLKLDKWTDSQITLSQNSHYSAAPETPPGEVVILIGRENPAQRFMEGDSDVAVLPYDLASEAAASGLTVTEVQKTAWCIVFNQNTKTWGNPLLRQALAYSLDYNAFSGSLTENFTPSRTLIPPASLTGGRSFREYAGYDSPVRYDPVRAKRLFDMGLDVLDYNSLPGTTLLVPETDSHALNMGHALQSWQKNLSVYINLRSVPAGELENRLASGDFEMMLIPFSPAGPQVKTLLTAFTSASAQNLFGYRSPMFDHVLSDALNQSAAERMASGFARAERAVLSDAVVIPVYFETTYYAFGRGVSGIEIQPFGNQIYFKYAVKT